MTNHDEDEALERELDKAAATVTKLALNALTKFLKGEAWIKVSRDEQSGDLYISFTE